MVVFEEIDIGQLLTIHAPISVVLPLRGNASGLNKQPAYHFRILDGD